MGKGGQENEALTTPCAWAWVFSPCSICSPVPFDLKIEGKKKHLAGRCLILAGQRPTALFIRALWHICADQVNMT